MKSNKSCNVKSECFFVNMELKCNKWYNNVKHVE